MTTVAATGFGRSAGRWVAGGLAVAFGLATLVEGGHVLFGGPATRAEAGNFVPFVVAFNFGAAFVYVATGVATLAARRWAVWSARALAVGTGLLAVAFAEYVATGGAFNRRTPLALAFRTGFWVAQAWVLPKLLTRARP